jgi:hypothetical protein
MWQKQVLTFASFAATGAGFGKATLAIAALALKSEPPPIWRTRELKVK